MDSLAWTRVQLAQTVVHLCIPHYTLFGRLVQAIGLLYRCMSYDGTIFIEIVLHLPTKRQVFIDTILPAALVYTYEKFIQTLVVVCTRNFGYE